MLKEKKTLSKIKLSCKLKEVKYALRPKETSICRKNVKLV